MPIRQYLRVGTNTSSLSCFLLHSPTMSCAALFILCMLLFSFFFGLLLIYTTGFIYLAHAQTVWRDDFTVDITANPNVDHVCSAIFLSHSLSATHFQLLHLPYPSPLLFLCKVMFIILAGVDCGDAMGWLVQLFAKVSIPFSSPHSFLFCIFLLFLLIISL